MIFKRHLLLNQLKCLLREKKKKKVHDYRFSLRIKIKSIKINNDDRYYKCLMSLFSQLIVLFFLSTDDTYKFDINFTWEIKN